MPSCSPPWLEYCSRFAFVTHISRGRSETRTTKGPCTLHVQYMNDAANPFSFNPASVVAVVVQAPYAPRPTTRLPSAYTTTLLTLHPSSHTHTDLQTLDGDPPPEQLSSSSIRAVSTSPVAHVDGLIYPRACGFACALRGGPKFSTHAFSS